MTKQSVHQHPLFKRYQHLRNRLRHHEPDMPCDWDRFRDFANDIEAHLGLPPGPGYYLHRVKPERGWTLKNLVWATRSEILLNLKWTKVFTYKRKKWTIKEFADHLDKNPSTIHRRMSMGWTPRQCAEHYGKI
jgi:hypothetical protein